MTTPITERSTPRYRTYGNWVRPRSPGLYGLGVVGSVLLLATPAAAVIGLLISPAVGITLAVLGIVLLIPMALKFNGRTVGELMFVRLAFWRARSRGEHRYLSGMLAEPYGQHRLPGLLAQSELIETHDGLGERAGVIIVPSTGHYTAVLRLNPEGASLVDVEQIDQWVGGYAMFLAQLAHEPGFVAASVTIETAPDPGTRLATAVAQQRDADAPELAHRVLDTIVDTYPSGSAQVTAWATVTYRSTGSNKKRGREAVISHIASRLPGLADTLRGTGAGAVRPMTAREIIETVRVAYDPAIATTVEQQRSEKSDLTWENAGPRADIAAWDHYQHDSGVSRVWSMDDAPRGVVVARVLEQLLAPHPQLPRKRVTLLYRPHGPGDAARIVDRDLRTANFVRNANRTIARESVTVRAAEQAAEEEAHGAGVTRFTLLASVTVPTIEDLDEADTIVDGLEGTARLQLRPVYAGQRPAFAVTLPTGLVLPEHVAIPTGMREAL